MSFLTFFLMKRKLLFVTGPQDYRNKGKRKQNYCKKFLKKVTIKFTEDNWIRVRIWNPN